jgi:hypothetical protein
MQRAFIPPAQPLCTYITDHWAVMASFRLQAESESESENDVKASYPLRSPPNLADKQKRRKLDCAGSRRKSPGRRRKSPGE